MKSAVVIDVFSSWLVNTKKLSQGTAKQYVRGIKAAGRYYLQGEINLLAPDAETMNVINTIFSDTTFLKDDKLKHKNMSCALKQYAEFLTSSTRNELFQQSKKVSPTAEEMQDTRERGGGNMEEEKEISSQKIVPILMEQISKIVKEQRKIVLDCLDSYENEVKEESVQAEKAASATIKKLGQWKAELTSIFKEMEEAGFSFELKSSDFKTQTTPTKTIVGEKPKVSVATVEEVEKPKVMPPPLEEPVAEEVKKPNPTVEIPVNPIVVKMAKVEAEEILLPSLVEKEKVEPLKQEGFLPLNHLDVASNHREMSLLGKRYTLKTPIERFVKVCEVMVLHRPYAVGTFHENKVLNPENRINFSYHESDMNQNGIRLNNGLWVNKNQEESEINALCYSVLKACGFGEKELTLGSF